MCLLIIPYANKNCADQPAHQRRLFRTIVVRLLDSICSCTALFESNLLQILMIPHHQATRGRKGDEEVLPYLSPRSMSRPQSGRHSETSSGKRPKSAPARQPRHRVHPSNGYVEPYSDVSVCVK